MVSDEEVYKDFSKGSDKPSLGSKLKSGFSSLGRMINPPKSAEQLEYEKRLRDEKVKAYRESYLKESVKQAKIRGYIKARPQRTGSNNSRDINSLNSILGIGNNKILGMRKQVLKHKIKNTKTISIDGKMYQLVNNSPRKKMLKRAIQKNSMSEDVSRMIMRL